MTNNKKTAKDKMNINIKERQLEHNKSVVNSWQDDIKRHEKEIKIIKRCIKTKQEEITKLECEIEVMKE